VPQRGAVGSGEDDRCAVVQAAGIRGVGGERDHFTGREGGLGSELAVGRGLCSEPAHHHPGQVGTGRLAGWMAATEQFLQYEHPGRVGET
jgi:hypothetical protein